MRVWRSAPTVPCGRRWLTRAAKSADYGPELWNEVGAYIAAVHNPQANMQGSGSFVVEGEALRELPPFAGDTVPLYDDYLPSEIVQRPDHKTWLTVVDGRGRMRGGYKGEDNPGCYMLHLTSRAAPPEYLAFLQRGEDTLHRRRRGAGRSAARDAQDEIVARCGVP